MIVYKSSDNREQVTIDYNCKNAVSNTPGRIRTCCCGQLMAIVIEGLIVRLYCSVCHIAVIVIGVIRNSAIKMTGLTRTSVDRGGVYGLWYCHYENCVELVE